MGYAKKPLYEKPSVLIGRKGSISKVQYIDKPFWTVDTLFYTKINTRLVYPHFLYYLMSTIDFSQYNEGTSIPSLRTETLNNIQFDIPSLAIQKNILNKLECIDQKININKAINGNLLELAQTMFDQYFLIKEYDGTPKSLYEYADYINGAAFKPEECGETGLPIIKIAELKNGISSSTKYFNGIKDPKYIIHNKDILFSWSGNPDTSIDIFIWAYGDAILNQHTFNVKPFHDNKWFTYLLLRHFKPEFANIARNKQTTGLGHVTASDLKRMSFMYNAEIINKFEITIQPIMELYYSNLCQIQTLTSLRDKILPKFLSGEIDIGATPF